MAALEGADDGTMAAAVTVLAADERGLPVRTQKGIFAQTTSHSRCRTCTHPLRTARTARRALV